MVASEERSADDEVDECKGEWTESESESDSLIFAVVSTPTFMEGRFKGKNDWTNNSEQIPTVLLQMWLMIAAASPDSYWLVPWTIGRSLYGIL